MRDERDLRAYIAGVLDNRNDRVSYPFIVIDRHTGEVAGSTRFGNIRFSSKRLEIGWTWYGEAYRGTSVNKAAKFELLRYAFETLGFNRVQFSVDAENLRSQKAVLKLGAKQEGIFRSNYENAQGECRDDIYYTQLVLPSHGPLPVATKMLPVAGSITAPARPQIADCVAAQLSGSASRYGRCKANSTHAAVCRLCSRESPHAPGTADDRRYIRQ